MLITASMIAFTFFIAFVIKGHYINTTKASFASKLILIITSQSFDRLLLGFDFELAIRLKTGMHEQMIENGNPSLCPSRQSSPFERSSHTDALCIAKAFE